MTLDAFLIVHFNMNVNSSDCVEHKRQKFTHTNESKEAEDDELPHGLISNTNRDYNVDDESDNVSEITPPKRSKFDLLSPLLEKLFYEQRSVVNSDLQKKYEKRLKLRSIMLRHQKFILLNLIVNHWKIFSFMMLDMAIYSDVFTWSLNY